MIEDNRQASVWQVAMLAAILFVGVTFVAGAFTSTTNVEVAETQTTG
jgi:hypothetical protein